MTISTKRFAVVSRTVYKDKSKTNPTKKLVSKWTISAQYTRIDDLVRNYNSIYKCWHKRKHVHDNHITWVHYRPVYLTNEMLEEHYTTGSIKHIP